MYLGSVAAGNHAWVRMIRLAPGAMVVVGDWMKKGTAGSLHSSSFYTISSFRRVDFLTVILAIMSGILSIFSETRSTM